MGRKRRLTPEERELWERVAATARARRAEGLQAPAPDDPGPLRPAPEPQAPEPPMVEPLRPFTLPGPRLPLSRIDLAPSPVEALAAHGVTMDRKTHRQMSRGRLEPEGRIDLHGLTLAQAHPELIRFILASQARGRRLVLVITGKGKRAEDHGPIPQRTGVLRHQVPHWLTAPPLRAAVMQITPAHLRHGGGGAYYVYLRRPR